MPEPRPCQIRRYTNGIDSWEMARAPAAPALKGKIAGYCAYAEKTASFSARRELAATSGVLIYALGDPLSITGADGTEIKLRAGEAFAGGIAEATSISRAFGPQRGIHIYMPLHSLAALCGAPFAELANRCVPLADLIGAPARQVGQALGEATSREDQFSLLDTFLARRITEPSYRDRPLLWAMQRLRRVDAPSVEALAGDIGWSRKHFTHRFTAVAGVTPQTFRRLARFQRLCAHMAQGGGLAALAAQAGYFDQAHLTREVAAFSGMTPAALRARALPEGGGVRHD